MTAKQRTRAPGPRPLWATACPTSLGWVGLAASAYGLVASCSPQATAVEAASALERRLGGALRRCYEEAQWLPCEGGLPPHLAAAREAYVDYAGGDRGGLGGLELDLRAHQPFSAAVLRSVYAIPAGKTMSYGEVAAAVGRPGAARAVGQVMANNPLAPIVPCHRVLGAGGKLVGYAGGTERKAELLRMENVPR